MPDERPLDVQEQEQQQLVRPPDLNQDTERSASRLELFFDLAFVFFVASCADVLAADESWVGAREFVGLMVVGWWTWASVTLHGNRFDTDDVVFRLLTLASMAGVVAMAASADEADGATGHWFALGYVLVRGMLVLGYVRAWRHVPAARASIRPYLLGHAAGAAIWSASIFVDEPLRFVLWGVGIAVDLVGPAVAARVEDGVPLHSEHLPERFALLVILVLGESVVGIGTAVHDGGWEPSIVLAAALAFVVAVTMWWLYFDFAGGAAKRRLVEEEEGDERAGRATTRHGVHDFYVYIHMPLAVGLAVVAVGLEHAVLYSPEGHLVASTRAVLGAGLAVYLLSAAVMQAVLTRQVRAALAWPGAAVLAVAAVTALDLRATTTLALLIVVLLLGLAAGVVQTRTGTVRTAKV
ncbi:low temperature requirement protein A [Quadrisphaera sp. DSM 44207]|uniref:low temperature requirement protein A n=1 Tax=Quadrisphaera sp. DSM 44207 TaxID=1881057 RepID=UPI00088CCBEF|nr:low temperature requirement protein A [Quadrisphaera sp. DSM 44207]SDQ12702.1 Low temperature requirement protein LtrA [Quadrisphaera sp. DSM 44207]